MRGFSVVAASILWAGLAAPASAQFVDIAIDIDSTRQSGANAGDPAWLATQSGFTSWDLTDVGTSGSTITVDGVTFEIFGLAGVNQTRLRRTADGEPNGGGGPFNDLLADFLFNEGAAGRAIGLRISGLPVGLYAMQSWHADYGISQVDEAVRIEVRDQGVADSTVWAIERFFFSPDPASFRFEVTAPDQVKEIIFRQNAPEPSTSTRARLNAFTIVTIPEPGSLLLAASGVVVLLWHRHRGRRHAGRRGFRLSVGFGD